MEDGVKYKHCRWQESLFQEILIYHQDNQGEHLDYVCGSVEGVTNNTLGETPKCDCELVLYI